MKIEKTDSPSTPYQHLACFAIAYGIAICILILMLSGPMSDGVAMIPIFAIVFSTVVLTAAWSVFGPGAYLKRVALAHCLAIIVAIGAGIGAMFLYVSASTWSYGPVFREILAMALVLILAIPAVSMAAQLPFWFFRMFFGWQFVHGETPLEKSYSLRDVFAATFLFAAAFAAPQFAANLDGVTELATYDYQMVTFEDGTESYEQVRLTDLDEIENRRRQIARDRSFTMQMGYLGAAAYALAVSLLGMPVVLFVFRSGTTQSGCVWTLVYAGGWGVLLLTIATIALGGGGPPIGEAIFYFGLTLGMMGAALWAPLTVSKIVGFRLTSPKRHQQERLQVKPDETN